MAAVLDAPGATIHDSSRESDYVGPSRAVHHYLQSVGKTDMLYHHQQRQDHMAVQDQATAAAAPKKGLKAKVQRLLAKCRWQQTAQGSLCGIHKPCLVVHVMCTSAVSVLLPRPAAAGVSNQSVPAASMHGCHVQPRDIQGR
jgi:hypothetical protein